jgi:hypothetical protein
MARIRTIKPEFKQSESIGRVSRDSRLTFVLMWTEADDSGRIRGSSRMLASILFPYDDDAPSLMDGWLSELEREHFIVRYVVDGTTYIQIYNWQKHQKIDKPSPSRIPAFVESSSNPREPSTPLPRTMDLGSRTVDHGASRQEPNGSEADSVGPLFTTREGAWRMSAGFRQSLAELFPTAPLDVELAKAAAWTEGATKKKTARGMHAFLMNWLSKDYAKPPTPPAERPSDDAMAELAAETARLRAAGQIK